jgi:hypothetical protein
VGDKSPKSKARQQKQDASQKNQKKAAAVAKSQPAPTKPLKSGK